MKLSDRKMILFWSKMATLFVGIVLALCYQFTGKAVLLYVGLSLFAVAFLLMSLTEIGELVALRAAVVEGETEEEKEKNRKELYNKKLVAAVKMALAGIMAVFTLVVMFLF